MRLRFVVFAAALGSLALAQNQNAFKTRLAPVALEISQQDVIAGVGQASATLAGSKVTIAGTFEGLKSAATIAQVHRSSVTGVRGPVVFDLTVDKATNGKISGSFDLSADQVALLRSGKLYIQIHSEKAPEGNLWGWLLP